MKKILLILLLLSATANAQVYMGIGAGYSATKQRPTGELQIGFSKQSLVLQTGFHMHLDSRNPALMQVQAGGRTWIGENTGVQLTGGYCFHYASNDDKTRNKRSYIISGQVFRPLGIGEWFASGSFTPGYFIISIGARGIIERK